MSDIGLSLLSSMLSSPKKLAILEQLNKERMTAGQMIKKTDSYQGHVSDRLKALEKLGLIFCENPKDLKFKFYKITDLGKRVYEECVRIKKES